MSIDMDILGAISEGWNWLGIEPQKVVATNSFGNVIFTDAQGRYWRICPEELKGEIIAERNADLDQLWASEVFQHDWRMESLCDVARGILGELPTGNSFCLKLPAALGNPYSAENMGVINTIELLCASGSLARQIRDLPDGTQVRIKVV